MTVPEKKKISAKALLADLRSGMDDMKIRRKHGLSETMLEKAIRKLIASGAITEQEVNAIRTPAPQEAAAVAEAPANPVWRCPACNAAHPTEPAECPSCGLIVSKFNTRQSKEMEPPPAPYVGSASGTGAGWIVTVSVVALVILAGAVWYFWPKHKPKERLTSPSVKARIDTSARFAEMKGGKLLELAFSEEGFPLGLSVSEGSALHLFETPSPNQGFKKFPPDTEAKRYYDEFRIAGRTFRVLTEASKPPKLYLDANGNGDMTDDPGPFEGESSSLVPNHYKILIPCQGEETPAPYRLWLFPSRMGGIKFYPKCHWEGQVELNFNQYKIVLFDANADGDYSNDHAVIDVDGDGKASESEMLKPGQTITVGDTNVKLLAIAPSGRWVRLDY